MKYTYKCFEDNAGCLHLAVLDDSGAIWQTKTGR